MTVIDSNVDTTRTAAAEGLFGAIDGKDTEALLARFHPDGQMVFGNGEPLRGHDEIRAGNDGFLGSIESISHEITGLWEFGDTTIVRLMVTYTLLDGAVHELPSCSIIRRSGELISSYQVYFDVGPLGLGT